MYDEPKFEGIRFESCGTMELANEEYLDIKGDTLLKLLPDLAVE